MDHTNTRGGGGPIDRYLETSGRLARELAEAAGISEAYLSKLRHGRKACGAEVGLRLLEASGGELDLEELLRWRRPADRPAA